LDPGQLPRVTLAAHSLSTVRARLAVHGLGRQARRAEGAPLKPWRKCHRSSSQAHRRRRVSQARRLAGRPGADQDTSWRPGVVG